MSWLRHSFSQVTARMQQIPPRGTTTAVTPTGARATAASERCHTHTAVAVKTTLPVAFGDTLALHRLAPTTGRRLFRIQSSFLTQLDS